jgi:hypothetical protein
MHAHDVTRFSHASIMRRATLAQADAGWQSVNNAA